MTTVGEDLGLRGHDIRHLAVIMNIAHQDEVRQAVAGDGPLLMGSTAIQALEMAVQHAREAMAMLPPQVRARHTGPARRLIGTAEAMLRKALADTIVAQAVWWDRGALGLSRSFLPPFSRDSRSFRGLLQSCKRCLPVRIIRLTEKAAEGRAARENEGLLSAAEAPRGAPRAAVRRRLCSLEAWQNNRAPRRGSGTRRRSPYC